ncbi:MAG: deoxyribose-phosphate aldolase [Chloroflexi bacterium]|nr:deoxyribose-phosphate aldolase [Chloroflexota bacterium]
MAIQHSPTDKAEQTANAAPTPGTNPTVTQDATAHRDPQPERHSVPTPTRNAGIPLDLGWVRAARVNRSAAERRAATLGTRRSIKQEWQAAWLLRAITCIDLTTLAGDDTATNVARLCAKARHPVRRDLLDALGVADKAITVGAACVYHQHVAQAVELLGDSGIPVAAVSTGFPAGKTPLKLRIQEIAESVAAGAHEIDIVISRDLVLAGNWRALYSEVQLYREVCADVHLKTILATGELGTLRNVYQASLVCMMAGADFIKTSTGKESVNATLEVSLIMARAIRDYQRWTNFKVGFKPAGGIRAAKQALVWQTLMKEELGDDWLFPALFRFGASALLTDIERQLAHHVTGRYAADYYMPMG